MVAQIVRYASCQDYLPRFSANYLIFQTQFLVLMATIYHLLKYLERIQMKNIVLLYKNAPKRNLYHLLPVSNTGLLVQCEECEMWHLVYASRKLSSTDKRKLNKCLEEHTFTCGSNLSDLNLTDNLSSVCVRDLNCYDPVEKLYYSVKNYEAICIYCSSTENLISNLDTYPQCTVCTKEPVQRRK